jgi:tRNA(Ile)-lysidine synthase
VLTQVRSTLNRHNMLPAGRRVIAAVSGGADSVALLHILHQLVPSALAGVAHFNHQLRGVESDGDERFVAALARQLGLPFHHACATPGPGNLEQNARRARQSFFLSLLEQGQADRIALGHTLDDQAETVLFRILRGSGLTGLAGILPVSAQGIVRPLLGVHRADVRTYLRNAAIAWREDSSNASPQFARNRIRHTLLPALQKDWNPRIVDALAHLGDVAYEEEACWAQQLAQREDLLTRRSGGVEIFTPRLTGLPRALLRRLAREAIRLVKGDLRGIDYTHIEQVVELAAAQAGSARRALPGVTLTRSFDWLLLRVPGPRTEIPPLAVSAPGMHSWPPDNPLIQLQITAAVHGPNACDTLDLELRGWRAGDQYRPQGFAHPVKLQDLFQKARVPSWRRASWPMVTSKGKILWAKEFGAAVGAASVLITVVDCSG